MAELTFRERAAHLYRIIQDVASDMRAVSRDRIEEDVRILEEIITIDIPEGGATEEQIAEINARIDQVEADLAQLRTEFEELDIPPGFDELTEKDVKILLNQLTGVTGFMTWTNASQETFELLIQQQNEDDQVGQLGYADYYGNNKLCFLGDAPYTLTANAEWSGGTNLSQWNYYRVYWSWNNGNIWGELLVGHGLTIPQGFEFLVSEAGSGINFQIYENGVGQQVTEVNTDVIFVNNTSEDLEYRPTAGNWSWPAYLKENFTTSHYNVWDYVRFYVNVDLTNASQSIKVEIRDENDNVIRTTTLNAGTNWQQRYVNQATNGLRTVKLVVDYV